MEKNTQLLRRPIKSSRSSYSSLEMGNGPYQDEKKNGKPLDLPQQRYDCTYPLKIAYVKHAKLLDLRKVA